eukprot:COSAG02_NODE_2211_length_9495_cov_3.415842_4_plen_128_part_00
MCVCVCVCVCVCACVFVRWNNSRSESTRLATYFYNPHCTRRRLRVHARLELGTQPTAQHLPPRSPTAATTRTHCFVLAGVPLSCPHHLAVDAPVVDPVFFTPALLVAARNTAAYAVDRAVQPLVSDL